MSSIQEDKPPEKPRFAHLPNAELVSRLLAATPPYLYSALPMQPHAYFFSEMLRSFVQARHGCRGPVPHARRMKKRTPKYFAGDENHDWQRRYESWKTHDENVKPESEVRKPGDIPLELTVEKHQRRPRELSPNRRPSPKIESAKSSSPGPPGRYLDVGVEEGLPKPSPCLRTNPQDAIQPNLILPPPPPMWYPPLYNLPFGMDPLNFFIDLRVSGHIYDRKRASETDIDPAVPDKMAAAAEVNNERRNIPGRPRHASAFSVPVRQDGGPQRYDHVSGNTEGTPYVMRNLKRIYDSLRTQSDSQKAEEQSAKAEVSDFTDVDDEVALN